MQMTHDNRISALAALGKLASWRADGRDEWLKVGMALHAASPDLLDDWDCWSRQSEKYKPGECTRQWRSFKPGGGVGVGTLVYMAQHDSGDPSFEPAVATRPPAISPPTVKPKNLKSHPTLDDALQFAAHSTGGTHVESWAYEYGNGKPAFLIARFDLPTVGDDGKIKKQFRPIHQATEGWIVGDPPGKLPLYGLPKLSGDDQVIVFEGERCANVAITLDLNATTSAHGAKSAKRTDWSPLAGRTVVIFPDNDFDGERYATDVAGILAELTPPARIKVVRLPDLPPKGDITDYVEMRDSSTSDEIREYINALADNAPVMLPGSSSENMPEPLRPAWVTPAAILAAPEYRRGLKVVSSGFECIDRAMGGGFVAGHTYIIGGRTGSAKSSLVTNMARLIGLNETSVLLFSLEDGPRLTTWRMHAASANVPLRILLHGATGHGPAIDALQQSADLIRGLPVRLTDVHELGDIIKTIELHASDGGEIVLIDQISKIHTSCMAHGASTYERVSEISEALRTAAIKCNLTIISVCQVNRMASRGKEELQISDLRDSGMLEQDAAGVLLLDKAIEPPVVGGQTPQHCKLLPVKIGKNRFGPAGQQVELIWYPRISRVDDDPTVVNRMGAAS